MNDILTLALMLIPKVSRKTVQEIYKYLINNQKELSPGEIKDLFIYAREFNKRIIVPDNEEVKEAVAKAENIIIESEKRDIKMLSILDKNFPERLKAIPDYPVNIFIKGNQECLNNDKSVAIIGTRKPTTHGEKIAERFSEVFCGKGYVVISGLAIGCDTFAHLGAVKTGGRTIAVLANGLDNVYPSSNRKLAENILEQNGCLISEYYLGIKPFNNQYVDRNRLQSGLSEAIIVVETDVKGGTMHTVGFAKKQNKIIACYKHKESFSQFNQTFGNKKLIENGTAIPLRIEDDIEYLLELIEKRISERTVDQNVKVSFSNDKQTSMFDY